MNTFEKAKIEYEMVENVCYVNGEHLVEHLKAAVSLAVSEVRKMLDEGMLDEVNYTVAVSSIQGMVGIGMWLEEGVIDATAEDFREMLDNPWPDMPEQTYNNNDRKEWVMSKIIVRTEKWGNAAKAVVRDEKGRFIGATNQTKTVPLQIVGK